LEKWVSPNEFNHRAREDHREFEKIKEISAYFVFSAVKSRGRPERLI
jgi:hypothetical protein